MENYILKDLSWSNLLAINGKSLEKTFELLCANFMKIKYKLDRVPLPSQNDNYPGLEGEVIEKDGLYYGYQAKYGEDAFLKNKGFEESFRVIENKLNEGAYKVSVLCLFSKKEYPIPNRQKRKKYFKEFENDNNLKIDKYFGNDFLSELKKKEYWEILDEYFAMDDRKREIYGKSKNKDDVCDLKLNNDINNVKSGFDGNYGSDFEKAKLYQKKYSYSKLSYSSHSFILDRFEQVEKSIAEEIFDELELGIYLSLDDYLDRCKKNLDDTNSKNIYKIELESIMNYKKGIFVNYGTQGLCCLNYIKEDKIKFKDKRYE